MREMLHDRKYLYGKHCDHFLLLVDRAYMEIKQVMDPQTQIRVGRPHNYMVIATGLVLLMRKFMVESEIRRHRGGGGFRWLRSLS